MIMLVPTSRSLRTSSSTNRYSRSRASFTFPEKLFTEVSMSSVSVSSLLGRLTVLSTAASRLRPGRSVFCTSRSRSIEATAISTPPPGAASNERHCRTASAGRYERHAVVIGRMRGGGRGAGEGPSAPVASPLEAPGKTPAVDREPEGSHGTREGSGDWRYGVRRRGDPAPAALQPAGGGGACHRRGQHRQAGGGCPLQPGGP